jgi:hypothetical protein
MVSFTPRPLYPRYALVVRLGGPQSRSGRRGEEKILDPTGTQTPVRSQSLSRAMVRFKLNSAHQSSYIQVCELGPFTTKLLFWAVRREGYFIYMTVRELIYSCVLVLRCHYEDNYFCIGFEGLTAMSMKSSVF